MLNSYFPELSLDGWRATRDTLHGYVKVLGKIRAVSAPREKHWSHISLRVTAAGLTTTPMPAGDRVVELVLNLADHRLHAFDNHGGHGEFPLEGQSPAIFCEMTLAALDRLGASPVADRTTFANAAGTYDRAAVTRFWRALPLIDAVLKRLRGEHRGESGALQFWPHGFDLALLLFTGRRVTGVDPMDEESADEQMNFGFTTGDPGIPEPYFYATAYPTPEKFAGSSLPDGAYWHTQGWTGAVLRYAALRERSNPTEALLGFFRAAREAGFNLMR